MLLNSTTICQKNARSMTAVTLRMFILILYATGALVSEILQLRRGDIDLRRRRLTFRSLTPALQRCVPLNIDLFRELKAFLYLDSPAPRRDAWVFHTDKSNRIDQIRMNECFRRLRRCAGICRRDDNKYLPRMQDFRATFAVHRLTSWIEGGMDLNRMLPALSVYMGHSGLAAASKYLVFTPERFRKELCKLSPQKVARHWREDPQLMRFLSDL